jgi:hypothetical protein
MHVIPERMFERHSAVAEHHAIIGLSAATNDRMVETWHSHVTAPTPGGLFRDAGAAVEYQLR